MHVNKLEIDFCCRLKVRRRMRVRLQVARPKQKKINLETPWRKEKSGAPARRRDGTGMFGLFQVV